MRDFLDMALNVAESCGATYADIRIIDTRNEKIDTRNGVLSGLERSESLGFGVRVIANGSWGFASSSNLCFDELRRVTVSACRLAKAAATVAGEHVRLASEPVHVDFWQTPFIIDPFTVPLQDKLGLLLQVDEILRHDARIKVAQGHMKFCRIHKWFASSEGARIEQVLLRSGGGFSAAAVDNGETQQRSYPASFGGQYKNMGYEIIPALRLPENAERIRDEAVELLSAPDCPQGRRDIILHPNQMMLQIHESVGHATELDRVLGMEANYAGTSFATTEKLGNLRYGSDIVNLVSDNTVPGGCSTAGYDDDGVAAQRWHIVKEGILVGYHTNRELAHVAGESRSRGSCRAEGFNNLPITRISNLSLMPGAWSYEDLLADSDGALLMECNRSWSIDQRRLNFQFGCETAREIKGGKPGRLFRNPTYQGITPQFWASCDAIADYRHWDLWGVINCGKGQPGQRSEMSHGSSYARFRNVEVGIR